MPVILEAEEHSTVVVRAEPTDDLHTLAMKMSTLRAHGRRVYLVLSEDDSHVRRALEAHADTLVFVHPSTPPDGVVALYPATHDVDEAAQALVHLAEFGDSGSYDLRRAIGGPAAVCVIAGPCAKAFEGLFLATEAASELATRNRSEITGLAWHVRGKERPSPHGLRRSIQIFLKERLFDLHCSVQITAESSFRVIMFARLTPYTTEGPQSGAAAG